MRHIETSCSTDFVFEQAVQPAVAAVAYFIKAHNPCGTVLALAVLAAGLRSCGPATCNTFVAAAQSAKDLGTIKGQPSVFSKVCTARCL